MVELDKEQTEPDVKVNGEPSLEPPSPPSPTSVSDAASSVKTDSDEPPIPSSHSVRLPPGSARRYIATGHFYVKRGGIGGSGGFRSYAPGDEIARDHVAECLAGGKPIAERGEERKDDV